MLNAQEPPPHLSVVVVSRNDDHGGNLLDRMQWFIDGLAAQCERHRLPTELIVVEWNPPDDRPNLMKALRWPDEHDYLSIRLITVPRDLHRQLDNSEALPLFQMIGKNVGIRRARGCFIVATNIDILFSDEVFDRIATAVQAGHLYRCDRYDVPPTLPNGAPFDTVLALCRQSAIRINARGCTYIRQGRKWVRSYSSKPLTALRLRLVAVGVAFMRRVKRLVALSIKGAAAVVLRLRAIAGSVGFVLRHPRRVLGRILLRCTQMHTNACGDFTLLAREDWFKLRGYPEWPIFSWHLDSVLLHQARANQIREVDWPTIASIYHIEHAHGSGYTPEGVELLFSRLQRANVPYITWPAFKDMAQKMNDDRLEGRAVIFNDEDWGMVGEDLPEATIGRRPTGATAPALAGDQP